MIPSSLTTSISTILFVVMVLLMMGVERLEQIDAAAAASVLVPQLTYENFLEMTKGKYIFVKAFAPWCGHCQAMAQDFMDLTERMGPKRDVLLIAEVDCTVEEQLCSDLGVEGYPTLFYGTTSDQHGYDGDRTLAAMSTFIEDKGLDQPHCSIYTLDHCDNKNGSGDGGLRDTYEKLMTLSLEELQTKMNTIEEELVKKQEETQTQLDALEEQYHIVAEAFDKWSDEYQSQHHYVAIRSLVLDKTTEQQEAAAAAAADESKTEL